MDLAYVAGIIDGEGYVSVDRNSAKDRCFVGKVVVHMASDILPRMLHATFGGNYRTCKRSNPNQSDAHIWALNGRQAVPFLERILPYLILKTDQAKCVLELYRLRDSCPIKHHPSKETLDGYEKIYEKAKSLCTRKGPRKKA